MPFRYSVAALLVGCVAVPAIAQDAQGLIAKNLEARGGEAAIAALKNVNFEGRTIFPGGFEVTYKETRARLPQGAADRVELGVQGMDITTAYDGRGGWRINPLQGRKDAETMSADEARSLADSALIEGPLLASRSDGSRVTYLGREDFDGTLAYKLKVSQKDGDEFTYWLDPDTFLEIKVDETRRRSAAPSTTSETELGDYEKVAGVYFPMSVESWGMGQSNQRPRTIIAKGTRQHRHRRQLFRSPAHRGAGGPKRRAGRAARSVESQSPTSNDRRAASARPRNAAEGEVTCCVSCCSLPPPTLAAAPGRRAIRRQLGDLRTSAFATSAPRPCPGEFRPSPGGTKRTERSRWSIGSASGGVWKSEDGGTTFKPLFDKQPVQSIGAVALDPNNKDVMWVGTGESWTRNSVSVGNGVYKTTDGGETWTNMGLPATERITRILVHPKNGNMVYVCAPGALWSDSPDRGLYKTSDGGKTWSLILKGANLSTGCASVAMDPTNPEHLLAGTWDFRRKGYEFRSGGNGPDAPSGSRFAESRDGGRTWTDLNATSRKGLPKQPWGRLEIAYAPTNPKQVYALIENVRPALFVSEDGGSSWQERDRSQWMVWRPFYFGRSCPTRRTPIEVWKMGFYVDRLRGRREELRQRRRRRARRLARFVDRPDQHPDHGRRQRWRAVVQRRWRHPLADGAEPADQPILPCQHRQQGPLPGLWRASGQQRLGRRPGISRRDQQQPLGKFARRRRLLGFPRSLRPELHLCRIAGRPHRARSTARRSQPRDIQPTAQYKEKLRFNWNTPIALSPNEKGTIYIGSQFLFRSRDHGVNWDRISPDLSPTTRSGSARSNRAESRSTTARPK